MVMMMVGGIYLFFVEPRSVLSNLLSFLVRRRWDDLLIVDPNNIYNYYYVREEEVLFIVIIIIIISIIIIIIVKRGTRSVFDRQTTLLLVSLFVGCTHSRTLHYEGYLLHNDKQSGCCIKYEVLLLRSIYLVLVVVVVAWCVAVRCAPTVRISLGIK